MKQIIFYVVNADWFFLSHRLGLALEAKQKGYEVYVLTKNTGKREVIESYGINFIEIHFDRSGTNPIKDLKVINELRSVYKRLKPSIVHHVTIKPALYGTIAARLSGLKNLKVINAISGLGYNFINDRKSLTQMVVNTLMNFAFKGSRANFIFQNPDDRSLYDKLGYLNKDNHILIKGAGVDAEINRYEPPADKERIRVILPARLLYDKGVIEFMDAAELLRDDLTGKAEFVVIGGIDLDNPAAILEQDIRKREIPGYLYWMGYSSEMMKEYVQSDIVCLPSYREGLPKALVEGMAVGRPIVTTDAPGCRECVDHGVNGFLVPVMDSIELAGALRTLCTDVGLRVQMGKASRKKMEAELSLHYVITSTFGFYETAGTIR